MNILGKDSYRIIINTLGYLCARFYGRKLRLAKGAHIVVVSPHPDDEAIGCGGLMNYLVRNHYRLSLIMMSRGEHCHPPQIIPHQEQKHIRSQCALRANTHIGLHESDIHLLDFTDGNINHRDPEMARLKTLLAELQPDAIFLPYEHDTSPEHRRVHHIVQELTAGMPVRLYSYCVWFWHNTRFREMVRTPWKQACSLHMNRKTLMLKSEMLARYTEAHNPEGIPYTGPLPRKMIEAQLRPYEIFFATPHALSARLHPDYIEKR